MTALRFFFRVTLRRAEAVDYIPIARQRQRLPVVLTRSEISRLLAATPRRHATGIERTVVAAANVGVQQAFRAFAAIGRYLSSEEPDLFARILEQLPEPSVDALDFTAQRVDDFFRHHSSPV